MTKDEAVSLVASHVAGNLLAGTVEEATGLHWTELERLGDADKERLSAAIDVVAARLFRMGTAPRDEEAGG